MRGFSPFSMKRALTELNISSLDAVWQRALANVGIEMEAGMLDLGIDNTRESARALQTLLADDADDNISWMVPRTLAR